MTWPMPYMNALAKAMWTRGVDVEIVLCHPASIPNEKLSLDMTEDVKKLN